MVKKNFVLSSRYSQDSGISYLVEELTLEGDTKEVNIDFRFLKWIELAPMTFLLGLLKGWQENGIAITFSGVSATTSPVHYLSRMNFFRILGNPIQENFNRHSSGNRFVEFTEITDRASSTADIVADEMACCITGESDDSEDFEFTDTPPEDNFYSSIAYSVSELIKNVQQHSCGTGFIAAQFYPSTGQTQIAIIDTGIGVRESFERSGSPHSAGIRSDHDALIKALEAEVSSKTHKGDPFGSSAENAGVGLTLLTDVAIQANGCYQLVSGNALLNDKGSCILGNDYKGTYVCLSFDRSELDQFQNLLENAKSKFLGQPEVNQAELEGIFEE